VVLGIFHPPCWEYASLCSLRIPVYFSFFFSFPLLRGGGCDKSLGVGLILSIKFSRFFFFLRPPSRWEPDCPFPFSAFSTCFSCRFFFSLCMRSKAPAFNWSVLFSLFPFRLVTSFVTPFGVTARCCWLPGLSLFTFFFPILPLLKPSLSFPVNVVCFLHSHYTFFFLRETSCHHFPRPSLLADPGPLAGLTPFPFPSVPAVQLHSLRPLLLRKPFATALPHPVPAPTTPRYLSLLLMYLIAGRGARLSAPRFLFYTPWSPLHAPGSENRFFEPRRTTSSLLFFHLFHFL